MNSWMFRWILLSILESQMFDVNLWPTAGQELLINSDDHVVHVATPKILHIPTLPD